MKKTFLALFIMLFVGGTYAQMPIILESDLIKLKAEAAAKSNSDRPAFRTRRASTSDEEQVVEEPAQQQTETAAKTTKQNTAAGKSKATTTTVDTNTDKTTSSNASSDYVKRYRERQKRIKNRN